jgi:hypothetical protein
MSTTVTLLVALVQGTQERPTILTTASRAPRQDLRIIYYDDAFLFAARSFGSSVGGGDTTEPGLFVHSREKGQWIQITAISTAGGRPFTVRRSRRRPQAASQSGRYELRYGSSCQPPNASCMFDART